MILIPFAFVITMATCITIPDPTPAKDSSVLFTGTTPCSNIIRPLHKIPFEADCKWNECQCIMVEWKLTLYRSAVTKEPTTYKLSSINRFIVKETNMYSQPGNKAEIEGKWTIRQGTKTNANAVVYKLDSGKPGISIAMLKLNDNLLHLLDKEDKLMIGNEFWSYTLNRVTDR